MARATEWAAVSLRVNDAGEPVTVVIGWEQQLEGKLVPAEVRGHP